MSAVKRRLYRGYTIEGPNAFHRWIVHAHAYAGDYGALPNFRTLKQAKAFVDHIIKDKEAGL